MKILDSSGAIINGIERSGTNGLVVTDKTEYTRYLSEKNKIERLNKMEEDISSLKESLSTIILLLKNGSH
jgi:hypothetical protein